MKNFLPIILATPAVYFLATRTIQTHKYELIPTVEVSSSRIPLSNTTFSNAPERGMTRGTSADGTYALSISEPLSGDKSDIVPFNLTDNRTQQTKELSFVGEHIISTRDYENVNPRTSFEWIDNKSVLVYQNQLPFKGPQDSIPYNTGITVWNFDLTTGKAIKILFVGKVYLTEAIKYSPSLGILWYVDDAGNVSALDVHTAESSIKTKLDNFKMAYRGQIFWSHAVNKILYFSQGAFSLVNPITGETKFLFQASTPYNVDDSHVWSPNDENVFVYPHLYLLQTGSLKDLTQIYKDLSINLFNSWADDDHLLIHDSETNDWFSLDVNDLSYKRAVVK